MNLRVALFALLPLAALADQRIPLSKQAPDDFALTVGGEYRAIATFASDFPVDAAGSSPDQPWVLDQRLRVRLGVQLKDFHLKTEWDLFSGQLAGHAWALGGQDERRLDRVPGVIDGGAFVPRRASVLLHRKTFDLEAGLVPSHWGLGLLANDGDHDPVFGRSDFGDRVVRLRATVRPPRADGKAPWNLTAALDWVVADDIGGFEQGYLAFQGVLAALHADPAGNAAGLYGVVRHQRELALGRNIGAFAIDGYVKRVLAVDGGATVELALEAAGILGTSQLGTSYTSPRRVSLGSGGVVADAGVTSAAKRFRFGLRGGLLSGDPDPDDGWSNGFRADRDFDVGMVIFDRVQGAVDAAAYNLITDPARSGHPPEGIDGLVGEGAATAAVWSQPNMRIAPADWIELRAGILVAARMGKVAQAFYSSRAGGSERTPLDETPPNSSLGTELDWAVRLGGALPVGGPDKLRLELLTQGGHALLGGALTAEPRWAHAVLLTGRFRW